MQLLMLGVADCFVNFVQWFSMIGCLIGVSLLAKHFGGDLHTQLLAAVFAGTIPMGILQSSSTQNDYAVSFWLVCFTYFSISLIRQEQIHWPYALGAGLSLGLAVLTKPTAYIFAGPFVLWAAYVFLSKFGFDSWKPALLIGAACLVLNSGHYTRNLSLFGSPIGPKTNMSYDVISPSSLLFNVDRNLALHRGSGIRSSIREFHRVLNIDINDPRTTWYSQLTKSQVLKPLLP